MIHYRTARLDELDAIEALYRKYLDNGGSLRGRIEKILRRPSTLSSVAEDTDTGKIVGLTVYEMGLILSCVNKQITADIRARIGEDALIYTGESLLVEDAYRDKKISRDLNRNILTQMKELSDTLGKPIYVLHEMWVYPDGHTPAYRVVESVYGIWEDLGIIPNFYRDYYSQGHLCPICGEHCVCSARITLSRIQRGDGD